MTAPDLAPDDRVQLRVATDDGVHLLLSHLNWSDPATGRISVAWPTPDARLFALHAGQRIMLEVSRPADALYTLETLLQRASMEEPPHLVLQPTAEWQRVQRRHTRRYAVEMRPSQTARLLASGGVQALSAVIADLSTGGIRLRTDVELEPGERLELAFGTPSGGAELRLRVTVVRVVPIVRDGRPAFDIGCQFVEPSVAEREHIVQFILAQQGAALSG